MSELLQVMVPDEAPGILLYALGPWVHDSHKPPIFRIRLADNKYYLENKHGTGKIGRWKPLGHALDFAIAVKGMTDLNDRELKKHGLSQWPSPAAITAELAKCGIAVA